MYVGIGCELLPSLGDEFLRCALRLRRRHYPARRHGARQVLEVGETPYSVSTTTYSIHCHEEQESSRTPFRLLPRPLDP
jgi:hypothetical protein